MIAECRGYDNCLRIASRTSSAHTTYAHFELHIYSSRAHSYDIWPTRHWAHTTLGPHDTGSIRHWAHTTLGSLRHCAHTTSGPHDTGPKRHWAHTTVCSYDTGLIRHFLAHTTLGPYYTGPIRTCIVPIRPALFTRNRTIGTHATYYRPARVAQCMWPIVAPCGFFYNIFVVSLNTNHALQYCRGNENHCELL